MTEAQRRRAEELAEKYACDSVPIFYEKRKFSFVAGYQAAIEDSFKSTNVIPIVSSSAIPQNEMHIVSPSGNVIIVTIFEDR